MIPLILDCNFMCHRAKHATGGLSSEDMATGIVFGFLTQLLAIGQQFESNRFFLCWDSKKSIRERHDPTYKANRKKKKLTKEEIKDRFTTKIQMNQLRKELLPLIGFKNIYMQTGLEGDDMMAVVAKRFSTIETESILITSDEDLFQCINKYTSWYTPTKKKQYTMLSFREEYGIFPSFWLNVKGIVGCTTDNVKGIKGVGEDSVVKWLQATLNTDTSYHDKIMKNAKKMLEKNMPLVKLPHERTRDIEIRGDDFKLRGLQKVFRRYDIRSHLTPDRLDEWERFFRGEFGRRPKKTKGFI